MDFAGAGSPPPRRRHPRRRVKFVVVAVGHRMPAWIRAGFAEYARRMPRESPLELVELKPEPRSGHPGPEGIRRILQAEHKRIVAALPAGCYQVVLDERGRSLTTRGLAEHVARWRGSTRAVAFIVGGADGTAPALREAADFVWSLSPLTLPHGLVRIVLAEQLYRAATILSGHPYHRD